MCHHINFLMWYMKKAPLFLELLKKKSHLSFQLVTKVGIIKLNKSEEECSLLGNAVRLGNLFFHILLQKCHVAQETPSESSKELEKQFNVPKVASVQIEEPQPIRKGSFT